MKKVISLLLCIVLVSGCTKQPAGDLAPVKQLNKSKSQPDKIDNHINPSPSPSPSLTPTPTPSPTPIPTSIATPEPSPTLIPSPLPLPEELPEEQSSIPEFSGSGISKTEIGILIGSVLTVLVVLGILWKFSCCCFGDKKSGKPASIPNHLRPNVNTKKDNPHNPFSFVPNPASEGDDNAPPFGNNGDLQGVSYQGSIPHL